MHNYGRRFIEKNYKAVLGQMEAAGRIIASPSREKRPMINGEPTFAAHVRVTFPKKAGGK